MHSEGGVWATLWGLLMWPVLFADVPEVCVRHYLRCVWHCWAQSQLAAGNIPV